MYSVPASVIIVVRIFLFLLKGVLVIKAFDELTITDDFMFGAVMSDPKYCKPLLELVLGVKIDRIEYPERQKAIAERYSSKSIRLDVYVADGAGTVYDVEMQTESRKNLPKRTRYYQGMIDLHILEQGEEYTKLAKSFVIFFCTFDPFEKGRWVYTFENLCREDPAIALGDESTKIILNTKGRVGEIDADLRDLLHYMDGKAPNNDYTKQLESAVADVRADEKWRREFMVLNELLRDRERLAKRSRSVAFVRDFRDEVQQDQLARFAYISPEQLNLILNAIDTHPDWDDEQIAESVDFE